MGSDTSKGLQQPATNPFGRRDFMKIVGGGIVIFFSSAPGKGPQAHAAQFPGMGGAPTDLNDFLKIAEDGNVTVFSGKVELGQANTTALAQMAADELGVPLESVTMIMGDTALCPYDMGTFGSMSIRVFGPQLRAAAAEAREILLELASERLNKPTSQLRLENGSVWAPGNAASRVSYGQLVQGQKITRKLDRKAATRSVAEFTLMGRSIPRLDGVEKVMGRAKYAADLRFPDLVYARVLRPPAHGSTLKSLDTSAAERIPGVSVVNQDGIVAVLHADPETATRALAGIRPEYDTPESGLDENTIFDHIVKTAPSPRSIGADSLVRVQRGQVVVENPVARLLGRLEIDRVDFDQRQVALPLVRHADLPGDDIARPQVEFAYLGRGDVDVVRPGQVVVVGRPQKSVSLGEDLEHPFGEDQPVFFRLGLQDGENQVLFAHLAGFRDIVFFGDLGEFLDVERLQLTDVQLLPFLVERLLDGDFLVAGSVIIARFFLCHSAPVSDEI